MPSLNNRVFDNGLSVLDTEASRIDRNLSGSYNIH